MQLALLALNFNLSDFKIIQGFQLVSNLYFSIAISKCYSFCFQLRHVWVEDYVDSYQYYSFFSKIFSYPHLLMVYFVKFYFHFESSLMIQYQANDMMNFEYHWIYHFAENKE